MPRQCSLLVQAVCHAGYPIHCITMLLQYVWIHPRSDRLDNISLCSASNRLGNKEFQQHRRWLYTAFCGGTADSIPVKLRCKYMSQFNMSHNTAHVIVASNPQKRNKVKKHKERHATIHLPDPAKKARRRFARELGNSDTTWDPFRRRCNACIWWQIMGDGSTQKEVALGSANCEFIRSRWTYEVSEQLGGHACGGPMLLRPFCPQSTGCKMLIGTIWRSAPKLGINTKMLSIIASSIDACGAVQAPSTSGYGSPYGAEPYPYPIIDYILKEHKRTKNIYACASRVFPHVFPTRRR